MKVDRELDALVAEKVMGWENNRNGPTYYGYGGNQIWAMNEFPFIDCPCYSTEIDDAWDVAEKMGDGFCVQYKDGKWRAGWFERLYAEADTAPMAICLVALRAAERGVSRDVENPSGGIY